MKGYLENKTEIEFHILAFTSSAEQRPVIFIVFFLVYFLAVAGNIIIITIVSLFSQLHTSMYFFLCNLSVLDVLYVSTTLPKLLFISYTGNNKMYFPECITQLYFFLFFADTESFLLTSMAFDRYVAICIPLHYSLIMNKTMCALLAIPAWIMGAVNAWILTNFVIGLLFCDLYEINNFLCDLKALLTISCSDTSYLRKFIFVDGTFIGTIPLMLTLTSYGCIISTILKIQSSNGRFKAFSSCTSHLTVVTLYYGSALCLYMRYSPQQDKYLSVMFVTMVPVFNPLVYSLRNKDILGALRKVIHWNKIIPLNV